jgi:hypothetical protein
MEFYVDLMRSSHDLELGGDEHDLDVLSIHKDVREPELHQIEDITHHRRIDDIVIPEALTPWQVVIGEHESFQPTSFMILTHTTP